MTFSNGICDATASNAQQPLPLKSLARSRAIATADLPSVGETRAFSPGLAGDRDLRCGIGLPGEVNAGLPYSLVVRRVESGGVSQRGVAELSSLCNSVS